MKLLQLPIQAALMKTTNRAASWRNLFNLPPHYVTYVQYAPGNTNNVIATSIDYFSITPRGGIWLSRNAGETWEQPSGCIPPGLPSGARLEGYSVATMPGSKPHFSRNQLWTCDQ
jgi:hypothetical protein